MPLQWDVLRALDEMCGRDEERLFKFLVDYFRTEVGSKEMPQGETPEGFAVRVLQAYREGVR